MTIYERCRFQAEKNKAEYPDKLAALVSRHTSDPRRQRRDWWVYVESWGEAFAAALLLVDDPGVGRSTETEAYDKVCADQAAISRARRMQKVRDAVDAVAREDRRYDPHLVPLSTLHRTRGLTLRFVFDVNGAVENAELVPT